MRRAPPLPQLTLLALLLAACSGPAPGNAADGPPCPVGDLGSPAELTLVARAGDGSVADAGPGADIPLVEPPQGGQVIFVGPRARNLDGCSLTVKATIADPGSGAVLGADERIVDLTVGPDGWAAPPSGAPISSFANVPVCPSAASQEVDGRSWRLVVTVTDRNQRTATLSTTVVPTCGDALCTAECMPH
jgi:hypothetical protein